METEPNGEKEPHPDMRTKRNARGVSNKSDAAAAALQLEPTVETWKGAQTETEATWGKAFEEAQKLLAVHREGVNPAEGRMQELEAQLAHHSNNVLHCDVRKHPDGRGHT